MLLQYNTFIHIVSVIGVILFIFCILYSFKLKKIILDPKEKKKWYMIDLLLLVFIGGYGYNLFASIYDFTVLHPNIVGSIYLIGSIFCFSLIYLSHQNYINIKKVYEEKTNILDDVISASKFKSEFLSTMSHELRTPLNAILGFAELFLEGLYGDLKGEEKGYMENIHESAERLLAMVDKILDISRIESEGLLLRPERIFIRDLLNEIINPLQNKLKHKNIQVNLIRMEPHEVVNADRYSLKLILSNLISNSFQFMEKGTVSIRLLKKRTSYEFCISDTGNGISQELNDDLFTEFKTGYGQKAGVGLGLPLVSRLVNLMKGNINYTTEEGRGTSFILEIPRIGDDELMVTSKSTRRDIFRRKIKLLIIEDMKSEVQMIKSLLIKALHSNFIISTAYSLEVGLAILEDNLPDVVLLDLNLPDSKGLNTVRVIVDNYPSVPIIVLTGNENREIALDSLTIGAEDFLSKNKLTSKNLEESILFSIYRRKKK